MSYEYSNKPATLDLTGSIPGKTMTPNSDSRDLERDSIGIMGIVFFVIAAAAPLTVVVALFPVIIGSGNGIGIAGAFVAVALVLLLFAVGYVAMSKHITNAGAFYAYITKGIGRPMGLGSASLAIFPITLFNLACTEVSAITSMSCSASNLTSICLGGFIPSRPWRCACGWGYGVCMQAPWCWRSCSRWRRQSS